MAQPAVPSAAREDSATPRGHRGLELQAGDVVALAGGTGMVLQNRLGHLETLLLLANPGRPIRFRNTAWQADTVHRRQRPLNFGSHPDFLRRTEATVMIACYGQMEALDGPGKLPEFVEAYERLIDEWSPQIRTIVLVTPFPFAPVPDRPHLPDLTRHNRHVQTYAQAILRLAQRRHCRAVDLRSFHADGLTRNGIHLTPPGQAEWTRAVLEQLLASPPVFRVDQDGAFESSQREALRQAVGHKNHLWERHWRPSNWAFLYGDRTHVPSSHDHRPGQPRWFPAEIKAILPMIDAAEQALFRMYE